ncbi:PAS domain S-box-containing protein/diguanylate cyclase (GGDEF) domain-containing protein [Oceanospirillum multiglobuliferum]|uniref:GGDEF domain-containing protein n=1 Tax=Oceanospirillum multiglobuliferum TaxID=64969 RepID=A0A1T4Q2K8_9GAMM|nr:EAL domain-containing protein [Oceanospirillum multiglobuliferum]OPX55486.1 hypothetical protein BTE48_08850 [Oceanospirillum multiglobuliferum]SJZ97856.1 PAS domain S-box-containing protein/diguanylate cyclase (GGDEF) domain-containing protein [Oceanospirillum multiglobuliferum]
MNTSALHKRLSYKQAKATLFVALALGLLFSFIQIGLDIKQSRHSMNDKVSQVIQLVEESAVQAAYNIDQELADRIVGSLIQHTYIQYAEIQLDDKSKLSSALRKPIQLSSLAELWSGSSVIYKIPLTSLYEGKSIGTLLVETDPEAFALDIVDRIVIILSTGFLRNILLAMCLLYVFHRLISRPLTTLSQGLQALKQNHDEHQLSKKVGDENTITSLPTLKGHDDDELGYLVDSFNTLWSSRNQAEQALRSSERFNRDVMNSISDILLICEKDLSIFDVNDQASKSLGYRKPDLIKLNLISICPEQNDDTESMPLEGLFFSQQDCAVETHLLRKDGTLMPVEIKSRHIELSGKHYILALARDISVRKTQEKLIHHLAYYDALTDLPNRSLFQDRLQQTLSKSTRHNEYGALLFLDLDRFKTINDSLGHDIGDELLKEIALRLAKMMRDEDTVARLGGDEFVVLLPELANDLKAAAQNARKITERILHTLSQTIHIGEHTLHISASIGIRLFPEAEVDAKSILKQADTAMYKAKSGGRNTFFFYNANMQVLADQHLSMEKALHSAIDNNELYLNYQPQVNQTHHITGAEVLVRWKNPEHGFVPPDQFIPLAEETGKILSIGAWILHEACSQLAQWEKAKLCPKGFRLAINISPKQFEQTDFISQLINVISSTNVNPYHLELELTEGILVKNLDALTTKMDAIRQMGIALSIDDFGTGYSSLKYLKKMPISQLKIDKSFIADLLTDTNDQAITGTIIAMAHHMQMEIIAEGVEDIPTVEKLTSMGCTHFQGYYFSRPVSAEDCTLLLQQEILPAKA